MGTIRAEKLFEKSGAMAMRLQEQLFKKDEAGWFFHESHRVCFSQAIHRIKESRRKTRRMNE